MSLVLKHENRVLRDHIKELEDHIKLLQAEVKEWLCISCKTVFPSPTGKISINCTCPKCGNAVAPRLSAELAEANRIISDLTHSMLPSRVFWRLSEWLDDDNRKDASTSFPVGMCRQIGYLMEMHFLPRMQLMRDELKQIKAHLNAYEDDLK